MIETHFCHYLVGVFVEMTTHNWWSKMHWFWVFIIFIIVLKIELFSIILIKILIVIINRIVVYLWGNSLIALVVTEWSLWQHIISPLALLIAPHPPSLLCKHNSPFSFFWHCWDHNIVRITQTWSWSWRSWRAPV